MNPDDAAAETGPGCNAGAHSVSDFDGCRAISVLDNRVIQV